MKGLVAPNGLSPFIEGVCQSPSQPRIIYAVGSGSFNGLFSSDDLGLTWTRRGSIEGNLFLAPCTVDADDPRTVYVEGFDTTWKSTDGGRSVEVFGTNVPACAAGELCSQHAEFSTSAKSAWPHRRMAE